MGRGKTGWVAMGAISCLVVGAALERVRQAVLMPISETAPQPDAVHAPPPLPSPAAVDQPAGEQGPHGEWSRDEFRQRMEQLKKEKPEQYAEMEKRRQDFQRQMGQDLQHRSDFLASLDTRNMSEAQKLNHEKLLKTLAKLDDLRAQVEQARGAPGSETETSYRQTVMRTEAELDALYEGERTCLLEQAALAVGCEGDGVSNFVNYIQAAIQSTTMERRGGPGGFGGPRPGGM